MDVILNLISFARLATSGHSIKKLEIIALSDTLEQVYGTNQGVISEDE
jgi:hypothetical protein